ncbi:MAG: hypothetical protein H2041_17330 [Phenylobacterium sp.]|jgi:antitoxin (DNA-binding transcriptional repressor) of toxin-antitoxin stability system|uniref:hypothetical protein n=1 Tax=Phenylobacterium sp. TaxID=1871053 RepID=UPI0008CFAF94|nr:hypothetical protein [Phenylobacterium sp.]MBA4795425.1 hypothetical protein [Phenylobacterium sp.]OHB34375.1 MAG: hypothetical protein A2882_07480 [Phenylobacterium sp. RIFCSPHIGHO2_01_FULL_70_10]
MKRLDLDDLPPKIAHLLASVEEDEELILVQGGALVARLRGGAPIPVQPAQEPEPYNNERAAEIFEQFRNAIEEDF